MRKNGFVFAETIIVSTILCATLIAIYASFTLIVNAQKEKMAYNQSKEIHSLYLIRDFILDTYGLIDNLPSTHHFTLFDCDKKSSSTDFYAYNSLLSGIKDDEYYMCVEIHNKTNLWNVYLVENKNGNDILHDLTLEEESLVNATFLSYLKTLSKIPDDNIEFRIIGEYTRGNDYYYASLVMPKNNVNTAVLLRTSILNNAGGVGNIVEKIADFDLEEVSPNMYKMIDYDGLDSYYYRGNVTNNYVFFAGYIWRIVRINGDGSIRIISDAQILDYNRYNILQSYNERIECETGNQSTIAQAIKCFNPGDVDYKSTHLMGMYQSWFDYSIPKGDKKYLVESSYCFDYAYSDSNVFNAYNRLSTPNPIPNLSCTFEPGYNNGQTKIYNSYYGMLSADEAMMAGLIFNNPILGKCYLSYASSAAPFYTSSLGGYNGVSMASGLFGISASGLYTVVDTGGQSTHRIVLNLASNVLATGDGSALNPYVMGGLQ